MIDPVDQIIIERLRNNCRASLQELARVSGISANAVIARIENLVDSGTIERFLVLLSPQMSDEDTAIAILEFSTEQNEKNLLESLSRNPSVHRVSRLLDGRYIVYGIYFDQEELNSLILHLNKLPGIKKIEMHFKFLHYWGGRIELTSAHREVLRCLLDDPRMSVSNIARVTGFESNKIKELIEHMRASEAVLFTITTSDDLDEKSTEVLAKVQWNVSQTSKEELLNWLQREFGSLRLGECVSAIEPVLFFHFSVKHVQEIEIVINKTKEFGLVTTIEPLIMFPGIKFSDPRQRRARVLLQETGFSSQGSPFA
ncbi:MAG: Lrp/AsnC family transcriptional regulator [Candidatus Thorarchaeota archaeon]